MKISFVSAILFVDGTPIPADELATEKFKIFIDTVNPPVQSFDVPQAAVDRATKNADGSLNVTVDAEADLSFVLGAPGTKYFLAADDTVDENGVVVVSDETPIITYTVPNPTKKPGPLTNFSVA